MQRLRQSSCAALPISRLAPFLFLLETGHSLLHRQTHSAAIGSSIVTSNLLHCIRLLLAPSTACRHSVDTINGSRASVKVDTTQPPTTLQWSPHNSATFTYNAHQTNLKHEWLTCTELLSRLYSTNMQRSYDPILWGDPIHVPL